MREDDVVRQRPEKRPAGADQNGDTGNGHVVDQPVFQERLDQPSAIHIGARPSLAPEHVEYFGGLECQNAHAIGAVRRNGLGVERVAQHHDRLFVGPFAEREDFLECSPTDDQAVHGVHEGRIAVVVADIGPLVQPFDVAVRTRDEAIEAGRDVHMARRHGLRASRAGYVLLRVFYHIVVLALARSLGG